MKLLCSIGLVALIALFFIPVNFTVDVEFWRTLMDVMHLPLFAVIAGLLYPFFKKRGEDMRLRHCRNAFAAAATVAIVIELVQPLMGRSQSMLDQMYGIVGAAFGAAFIYLWPKRLEGYNVLVLLAGAIAVGAAIAGPPMRKYRTIEHRLEEFPMLGSFEDAEDLSLWRPNSYSFTGEGRYRSSTNYATQGEFSQEVVAAVGGWPGVSFDAGEQDWSMYEALAFDVYNTGSEFLLFARIDGSGVSGMEGGRYDHEFFMQKGQNHLRIPIEQIRAGTKGRELDLKAIHRVVLFIDSASAPRTFYLDNVRLTNEPAE